MQVSYKQLIAFVQLAQSNSYAQAAEQLHITQPALSIAIKKLETELGGALILRTTRSVELTPEGKHFLPAAKRLLTQWDTSIQDIKHRFALQRGNLPIACMPSFAESYLPDVLNVFYQQHPNITLRVHDEVMEEAIESVTAGKAELAFVFEPTKSDGLTFIPLFSNGFVVTMPANHHFATQTRLTWSEIISEPHVIMHKGTTVRTWIDASLAAPDALKIVAETGQLSTMGQLVTKNMGIAVVPELCTQQMRRYGLCCVPLDDDNLRKRIGIIHSSRRALSVAASALVAQCEIQFRGSEIIST